MIYDTSELWKHANWISNIIPFMLIKAGDFTKPENTLETINTLILGLPVLFCCVLFDWVLGIRPTSFY